MQSPRGGESDPAQLSRMLPPPFLPPFRPLFRSRRRCSGAVQGEQSRLSPRLPPTPRWLRGGSRRTPPARPRPGPPSAGAHSASRRRGGRTPSPGTGSPAPSPPIRAAATRPPLTQAHGTSCPAPAPHAGKWRRRGAWAPREEAGQRWRRSAAPPCFPPSARRALGSAPVSAAAAERERGAGGPRSGAGRDAPMPAVGRRVRSPFPLTPCSLSRSCWVKQGWPRRHRGFGSFPDFRLGLGTPAQSL